MRSRATKRNQRLDHSLEDELADAVQDHRPDVAEGIWRAGLDEALKLAGKSEYERAGDYLTKLKRLFSAEGHDQAWVRLLAELRETQRRRPRMLDVLERVTKQKINKANPRRGKR